MQPIIGKNAKIDFVFNGDDSISKIEEMIE